MHGQQDNLDGRGAAAGGGSRAARNPGWATSSESQAWCGTGTTRRGGRVWAVATSISTKAGPNLQAAAEPGMSSTAEDCCCSSAERAVIAPELAAVQQHNSAAARLPRSSIEVPPMHPAAAGPALPAADAAQTLNDEPAIDAVDAVHATFASDDPDGESRDGVFSLLGTSRHTFTTSLPNLSSIANPVNECLAAGPVVVAMAACEELEHAGGLPAPGAGFTLQTGTAMNVYALTSSDTMAVEQAPAPVADATALNVSNQCLAASAEALHRQIALDHEETLEYEAGHELCATDSSVEQAGGGGADDDDDDDADVQMVRGRGVCTRLLCRRADPSACCGRRAGAAAALLNLWLLLLLLLLLHVAC